MPELLAEYLPIVVFLGISIVLVTAFLVAPMIVAPSNPDPEKLSAYECGFNSKTVFNTFCKKATGLTPGVYWKSLCQ